MKCPKCQHFADVAAKYCAECESSLNSFSGRGFQQGFVFVEHLRHLGDGEKMARCRVVEKFDGRR
jgi:predicted amidophosphoribosyltransferase